jgi:hypothetical protein
VKIVEIVVDIVEKTVEVIVVDIVEKTVEHVNHLPL